MSRVGTPVILVNLPFLFFVPWPPKYKSGGERKHEPRDSQVQGSGFRV